MLEHITPYSVIIALIYGACAAICGLASLECHRHPSLKLKGVTAMGRERTTWQLSKIILTFLGFFRLIGLQNFVTEAGRKMAISGFWYEVRRDVQFGIILMIISLLWLAGFRMLLSFQKLNKLVIVSFVQLSLLFTITLINIISLHQIDAVLYFGIGRFTVFNIIEFASLLGISVSAYLYRLESVSVRR